MAAPDEIAPEVGQHASFEGPEEEPSRPFDTRIWLRDMDPFLPSIS